MVETIYYEMPEPIVLAELVEKIPNNWCFITAYLTATPYLYNSGIVAKNTCLQMSRLSPEAVRIVYSVDVPFGEIHKRPLDETPPNIEAVVCGDKIYSSLHLHKAGFEANERLMQLAKDLASHFIIQGYKGGLGAYTQPSRNNLDDHPEKFAVAMGNTTQNSDVQKYLLPHIKLQWKPEIGGKIESFAPFIKFMDEVGINQFDPVRTHEHS